MTAETRHGPEERATGTTTVLVTGAGTATCQSVIKGLRSQNELPIRVVTADADSHVAGRYLADAFHQIPAAREDRFLDVLLGICRREEVDLLVPIVDYEFEKLAHSRERLGAEGTRVVISDPGVVEICNDKWLTHRFFRETDVDTPRTWLSDEIAPEAVDYPVFVKPRILGRASLDTHWVEDPAELAFRLDRMDEAIVQEAVRGREFTIDVLCDFQGRVIGSVPRERLETKSGLSYKGRTVRDERLMRLGARVASELGIIGPCNIQCFVRDDEVLVFEVNPRFSGTLVLSIAAGFNAPLRLVRTHRVGNGTPPDGRVEFDEEVLMLRYWQEMFVRTAANGGEPSDGKVFGPLPARPPADR